MLITLTAATSQAQDSDFNYVVDQFADVQILRYRVPGFEDLTPRQKELIYYLSQAAEAGRDILFDQNNRDNLLIRKELENIYLNYKGDRNSEDFRQFEIYLKRVWFSNGIHHHYSMDKFTPGFSEEFFIEAYQQSLNLFLPDDGMQYEYTTSLPILLSVIFDPTVFPKRVNQTEGEDLILTSANNYYHSVDDHKPITQKEVEDFYASKRNPNDKTPISYGLNSRLLKYESALAEQVWKINGMYSDQIERIVFWLNKAKTVAENGQQQKVISLLIDFYTTGDLKTFDDYSIAWVQDTLSHIDFLNGFIETYGDPLGIKASWEALVNFKDLEATRRTEIISAHAQWFEDRSPVDERFKKKEVKGVSAKVVTAAMLGGDCYPATPIGINLPNANWIRQHYGSKSVTLDNITEAYDRAAQGTGFNEEFMIGQEEIDRKLKYGKLADDMHTDLHECLGHGSGQLLPGISQDALKAYGATIEEARADLFALYYIADPKMTELGLLPDGEAYKAEYYNYMMNGLMTQLVRIEPGKDIEESHMRNRALIARWVYENAYSKGGKITEDSGCALIAVPVVQLVEREGKTFVQINDYEKLREWFGKLLAEIQRIKSEGDYEAAKNLVENYGVKVKHDLHSEMLERYKKLNIAPYKGFVNPRYFPVYDENGDMIDVKIDYSEEFVQQMLRLGGY